MINSIGCIPTAAARRYGDKTALVCPERRLSFTELDILSNRCANALTDLGVEPGDRVTLYSGNCWEWVVSYYGALKTGAVINPINVMLTPGEVEFVANDCGASIVLASHEKALSIQGVREKSQVRELIAFGEEELPEGMLSFNALLEAGHDEFEIADIDRDSLSTIGYTSGTTGHPKGACLSHHNILL
jgi:long-chain acyl-CoA synthetase